MTSSGNPILVTGAGGRIGGALAAELERTGVPVRLAFHDPAIAGKARDAGSDAVAIELADAATLPAALDGVKTVFLLTAETPDQADHELTMIRAAEAAAVGRVVKLSVWRADEQLTSIARLHRRAEEALETSGLAWTFLRPTTFMQNFLHDADEIAGGVLAQPASDAPVAFIDNSDVARAAAAVLASEAHDGRAYALTGPEALTYHEAAATFASVLGRPVEYRGLSEDDARTAMHDAGMPDWQVEMIAEVSLAYRDGGRSQVTPHLEQLTGAPPRSLERFVADHRAAFG